MLLTRPYKHHQDQQQQQKLIKTLAIYNLRAKIDTNHRPAVSFCTISFSYSTLTPKQNDTSRLYFSSCIFQDFCYIIIIIVITYCIIIKTMIVHSLLLVGFSGRENTHHLSERCQRLYISKNYLYHSNCNIST